MHGLQRVAVRGGGFPALAQPISFALKPEPVAPIAIVYLVAAA